MFIRNIALAGLVTVVLGVSQVWAQNETLRTVPSIAVPATVTLGGTVIPIKDVTFAAQIPGRVESIAGEEGDQFEEGAELITINIDDLLAKRRAAWANLANTEASLRNAGVQYSREWINPYGGQTNDMMGGMGSIMRSFTGPMQSFTGNSPGMDRHAQLYQYGTQIETARGQLPTRVALVDLFAPEPLQAIPPPRLDPSWRDAQRLAQAWRSIADDRLHEADKLLRMIDFAAAGDEEYHTVLDEIRARHLHMAQDLLPADAVQTYMAAFDADRDDIADVARAAVVTGVVTEHTRGVVSGYGELWSAQLMHAQLTDRWARL